MTGSDRITLPLDRESIQAYVREVNAIFAQDIRKFGEFANARIFSSPLIERLKFLDPLGADYSEIVMRMYKLISGVSEYHPDKCELDPNLPADLDGRILFPFSTGDCETVANYFSGISHIFKSSAVTPKSVVVEYGAGWGHVSTMFAQFGCPTYAIDIEPRFVASLNLRARRENLPLRAFVGEFGDLPAGVPRPDVVIFYEAFHHCFDHAAVMSSLRCALDTGAVVIFAGEPIHKYEAIPWGIRVDGHAVWAIANFGWMELTFREDYFTGLLARSGFSVEQRDSPLGIPHGTLWRAVAVSC